MNIKDPAIAPYEIRSNYNGLTLWEIGEKKEQKLMEAELHELPKLLHDVIRRKLAAMEGDVSLLEYSNILAGLQQMMKEALNIKE